MRSSPAERGTHRRPGPAGVNVMPATPVGRLLARFAVRRMVGSSGPGITRHGTPCGDEREITSMENKMTERYISYIPRKLPTDGRVVVHNRVRPVVPACDCFPVEQHGRDMIGLGYTPAPGGEGFRLWIQTNSRSLCRCDCGCLPVPHYRERREDDPRKSWKGEQYAKEPVEPFTACEQQCEVVAREALETRDD